MSAVVEKQSKKESEDAECAGEKIFSSKILPPLYMTAAYLFFLHAMGNSLQSDLATLNVGATEHQDPFKHVWWSGPIGFSILYLLMVYVGTRYMKDKEPYAIKPYMFTYNLYQCMLNLWCVAAMIHEVYTNPWFKAPWGNSPERGPGGFRISFLVWIHYNNKYVELLDTVFMVLRKKDRQISFLHCYHHVLLIWGWFLVCKVDSGGDSYFGACVNSFIHVIMYGYYTLALLGMPCPWKRWITNCQMIQFCVCLAHSCYVVWKGNMPVVLPLAQAFVIINMLVLFGNFINQNYKKKSAASAELKQD